MGGNFLGGVLRRAAAGGAVPGPRGPAGGGGLGGCGNGDGRLWVSSLRRPSLGHADLVGGFGDDSAGGPVLETVVDGREAWLVGVRDRLLHGGDDRVGEFRFSPGRQE